MAKLSLVTLGLGLSLAGLAACHDKPSPRLSADDAAAVLINRNWIDRWPESKTDRLHVYRFVPGMGGGVFQDRTVFKGTFELFRFEVEGGDHIVFDLPETQQLVSSQFAIETVAGPPPFDLKLTIWTDPRGPHHYYGIRAETDRDGHVLEQKLAAKR
jgi:hypothetical protein